MRYFTGTRVSSVDVLRISVLFVCSNREADDESDQRDVVPAGCISFEREARPRDEN